MLAAPERSISSPVMTKVAPGASSHRQGEQGLRGLSQGRHLAVGRLGRARLARHGKPIQDRRQHDQDDDGAADRGHGAASGIAGSPLEERVSKRRSRMLEKQLRP